MQPLAKSYTHIIEKKLYSQSPAPTKESLDHLKTLLCQDNFKNHKPLNNLVDLALKLGLIPYIKRDGLNVVNPSYKSGDLIGIYFAKKVSLNKNNSLFIRGKFCGLDLTEETMNLQLFATDEKANSQVIELAKKYGLEDQIFRGSLRVSLSCSKVSELVAEFIAIVKLRA